MMLMLMVVVGINVDIGKRATVVGSVAIIDNITIVAGRFLLVVSDSGRVPTVVDIVQQVRCRYSFPVLVLVLRIHCIRISTILSGITKDEGTIRAGTDFGNVLEAQHIRGHAECVAKAPAYLRCRRRSGCFAVAVDDRSTRTGSNFRRIVAGTGPTTGDGHRIVYGGRRRGRRGDCRIERRGRQLVRFWCSLNVFETLLDVDGQFGASPRSDKHVIEFWQFVHV